MAVKPSDPEAAVSRWAEAMPGRLVEPDTGDLHAFALDGKSARGSFDELAKAVLCGRWWPTGPA